MKNFRNLLLTTIFSFFLTLALVFPGKVFGLAIGGVGILPANPDPSNPLTKSWFIYTMDRGESKEDAVNVFNNSDDEVVVKVYPVDATTTEDGNFTLVDEFASQTSVGAWVKLFAYEVGLAPHEVKKIPFTISVPDNADVGDHMGGIIVQEISRGPKGVKKEGMTMSIVTRIGARIYLTVPGERIESLEFKEFGYYFVSSKMGWLKDFLNLNYFTNFFLTLKNNGNVRIEPETTIKIKNIFGKTVEEINGKVGLVFPKKESTIHLGWQKPMFLGRYQVTAEVKYSPNKPVVSKSLVLWVVPYRLLMIIGGLIVLVVLVRLIYLYLKELAKEKMLIYQLTKKETIQEVAEKFKVNWAKLARINNLKKPYELKKGQKLFIPPNRRNQELLKVLLAKGVMEPSIEEKLGKKKKSLFYKIHQGKKSLKILLIALLILIIGGLLTWFFYSRAKKQPSQEIPVTYVSAVPEEPSEDASRTRGGELKRSEISLAVYQAASTADNVEKLVKKLKFVGFQVEKTVTPGKSAYEKTTFEFKKDKQEAGRAVSGALALKESDVNLVERENLAYDVLIAYFVGEIFDLELPELTEEDLSILQPGLSQTNTNLNTNANVENKTTITITVLNGGAPAGSAGSAATLIKAAGYTQVTAANADNFSYQGVTISYQAGYLEAAEEIKNILSSSYANIKLEEKAELTINIQVILGS